ncbi:MAG: caspase family protein, partial [Chlorobi bacterium]|nr:caspase family protein [Chlorobiota bacterium]
IDVNERFTAKKQHDYNFYISSSDLNKPVKLVIYGTDYDSDNDGDYTDFAVYVNNEKVFYAEDLVKYGLGTNGSKDGAVLDISDYLKSGDNTVTLQNTETLDQRDYCRIDWIQIKSIGSSEDLTNIIPLSVNQPNYTGQEFTCQTKRVYSFEIDDLSTVRDAKLILNGYDTDYDNDGDYTDFAVRVNGNTLFEFVTLKDKGIGADGNVENLVLDIEKYLQQGENEIILENTETEGQVDYAYIKNITISIQKPQYAYEIKLNTPYYLDKTFKCTDELKLSVNISNPETYRNFRLFINGTDYDYDSDGDYTDFLVQVNSDVVLDTKPMTENGIGKNGNYGDVIFDIKPYITNGNNIIILKNTEEEGQVDYVHVKTVEIKGSKSYTTDNIPPEITITEPKTGKITVSTAKTVSVEGFVKDDDGIGRILVNGINARITSGGNFFAEIPVTTGNNNITVVAIDKKGLSGIKSFVITVGKEQNTVTTAEILPQKGKYYALIMGVSDYDDPQIPDLRGEPINDARNLYNILTQNYTFEPQNVKLLLNPTYRQIIRSFDDFSKKITEDDNFLIFYAGHGDWDENSEIGYWLPKDAELGYTDAWLYNSVLVDNIRKINSKHTLLLADACFSGGIFKTRSLQSNASKAVRKKYELKSRNAITSGALKSVPNKSVFFKYLSNRLLNNQERYLPASQLFRQIEIPVGNNSPNTPQFGDIKNVGDEGGDFIFIKK